MFCVYARSCTYRPLAHVHVPHHGYHFYGWVGSVQEGERDTLYSAYQILSDVMVTEHYLCMEMHLLRLTSGYSSI